MATLTAAQLEEYRVRVAQRVGASAVATQANLEAAIQALETWWTSGQLVAPLLSADAVMDAASLVPLSVRERAAVKAIWLDARGARDLAVL